MVREVAFADGKEAWYRSLQLVVNPDTTHRIVDGRVNHHWIIVFYAVDLICQFSGEHVSDLFVHFKQVAITLHDLVNTEAVDGL